MRAMSPASDTWFDSAHVISIVRSLAYDFECTENKVKWNGFTNFRTEFKQTCTMHSNIELYTIFSFVSYCICVKYFEE